MPDNQSDSHDRPLADGDTRGTPVPPHKHNDKTKQTIQTKQKTNRGRFVGIISALVVAVLVIVAIISGFIRFDTPNAQQPTNVEQLIKDEVQKAKDADQATLDKVQKEAADQKAKLQKEIDDLKKSPASPTATTVGNADGASTPSADAAQTNLNRDTFRKLVQENGQREGVDYRFDIDRNKASMVNPGVGVFGKPVFNEQELVSSLGDGSATSERALKALQDKQLEKNGLTVGRQNLLDARNYVCVQQLQPNKSNDMAYVAADGSIVWDNKLVDPAYSVNCAYVGPEVRAALTAGKKVLAIGKRGACLNTEVMPVTVNEIPTLPLLETPVAHKPTVTVITVVNKTKIEICELLTKKIITIDKDQFDASRHTTDLTKCQVVPVKIQVCDLKTNQVITIDKDQFDASRHTTDISKCKPEAKDPTKDPVNQGNAPSNGTPMPDPGPATPPAVPQADAPTTSTPPAAPKPTEVPRVTPAPTNEGASPVTPVTGVIDGNTCAVCGGGMSSAQPAPATAASVQPVAATAPVVAPMAAPVAAAKAVTPVAAAPAAAPAPAPTTHVATQVASAPAVTVASAPVAAAHATVAVATTATTTTG